jgi:molecular chaperone GrpE
MPSSDSGRRGRRSAPPLPTKGNGRFRRKWLISSQNVGKNRIISHFVASKNVISIRPRLRQGHGGPGGITGLPCGAISCMVPGYGYAMKKSATIKHKMPDTRTTTDTDNDGTEPGEAPAPEILTPEQLDDLKARAARADENWERVLRTTADFENYKKRAAREREEATKFANESLIKKLVTVLDNFDMALAAAGTQPPEASQSLQTGVAMIHQQLRNVLQEAGLEEVDAAGKKFDPNWHEAVSQQDSAEVPEGQVLQQLRKGYKLRDRLIRPATVVVARKPAG